MSTPADHREGAHHGGGAVVGDGGAIHDIGYRRYDGERLGPLSIERALFVEGLRGAFGLGRTTKAKIVPFLLLAALLLPTVIITLVRVLTGDLLPVTYAAYLHSTQVLIAIFVASQAPALVSRDLRHRVVSLYFSRPITRTGYVRAKFAAMASATFLLMCAPLVSLFAGALIAELSFREEFPEFLIGIAAAALIALLLAGISLAIASCTPRRGIGVAAIIAVLLVLAVVEQFVDAIGNETGHDALEEWSSVLSPFSLVRSIAHHLLRGDTLSIAAAPSTATGLGYLAAWAGFIALTVGFLVLRYRKVSVS
ncbi:MAG: integral rane protein [Thermoleophilia bacterium]|nr:integral rane protein [Thermoleophilia bacterium]